MERRQTSLLALASIFIVPILLLFSSPSLAVQIVQWQATPTSADQGDPVNASYQYSVDAFTLAVGTGTVTIFRDGARVGQFQAFTIQESTQELPSLVSGTVGLPADLIADPGQYIAELVISGTEESTETASVPVPFSDTAATNFEIIAPIQATVVEPASLDLSGEPGETVTGTFTITAGEEPFSVTAAIGSVDNTNPSLGQPVTYSFTVPSDAADQQQFSDTITVIPALGESVTLPVSITAVVPDTTVPQVQPTTLQISGAAGESATGSFTIIGGSGPFTVTVANTERGEVDNPTPDLGDTVTYSFRIPSTATDQQQFTDSITVTGANGLQTVIPVTITASVSDGAPPQSEIDEAMQAIANTQPQSATAAVISEVCPQGIVEPRLQQDCDTVIAAALEPDGSTVQQEASVSLAQVTSDQASAPVNASQTSIQAQGRNIASRITALRMGATGFSSNRLTVNLNGESVPASALAQELWGKLLAANGGAAGSDQALELGRLGVFINGSISLGDKDRTDNVEGFDFTTKGITIGADYRFTDRLVAGLAAGYVTTDTDLDSNGGDLDTDGYSLSLYGTFYRDEGLYLDGILTYGRNDYDQRRRIIYNIDEVSVNQTAKSSFDGHQWSAALGGGYSFNRGALNFGPTLRLEYVKADVDGYQERMSDPEADGGGWAARIGDQEAKSFTSQLGGEVSYAMSQSWGVLIPQAHFEWVHEFKDGDEVVTGFFVQDPSQTTFALDTDSPDSNYFNLRLGVSAQFAKGRSGYFYYRKLLGYDNIDVNAFSAGLRLEF
jgi:outer membrane autotransporter protein